MARALGTGEDRSPSGAKPSFPVWRTPKQWPGDGPGVRPTQLPFVFFLLGSFPKQTNQGGKTERTWRRGKCQAGWLGPGTCGLPGKGSAGAPFPAGVPEGAKPQTGRGPQTGTPGNGKALHAASGNMSAMHLNAQVLCSPLFSRPMPGAWWPMTTVGVNLQVSLGFMLQGRLPGPLLGQQGRSHSPFPLQYLWGK